MFLKENLLKKEFGPELAALAIKDCSLHYDMIQPVIDLANDHIGREVMYET